MMNFSSFAGCKTGLSILLLKKVLRFNKIDVHSIFQVLVYHRKIKKQNVLGFSKIKSSVLSLSSLRKYAMMYCLKNNVFSLEK